MGDARGRHRIVRNLTISVGWCAVVPATLIVLAWMLGLLLSDRWVWSQWLAWIPSLIALGAASLGFAAAWRPAPLRTRRGRIVAWSAVLLLVSIYIAFIDHRLLRPAPIIPEDALRIVHWNASPAERRERNVAADLVLDLDVDITILTDAHLVPWHRIAMDRFGADGHFTSSFPFAFISRLPILNVQRLVAVDDIYAVSVRIDARATSIGRELSILVIDLPSDLSLSRMALARRVTRLLSEAGASPADADLILGDFNITRGSASLAHLTPTMRHAWNEAGRGWSGTYPRGAALFHIDHIFINPESLRAVDYETLDLGVGRHRAQRVVIEPR